jgi:hypothetical protein
MALPSLPAAAVSAEAAKQYLAQQQQPQRLDPGNRPQSKHSRHQPIPKLQRQEREHKEGNNTHHNHSNYPNKSMSFHRIDLNQ